MPGFEELIMGFEADQEGNGLRELGQLEIADGRRLDLCEVGDPEGRAVLYFHGTGSSRLEVVPYAAAARKHGIRLLAWNRPGTGSSIDQPGRTMRDVIFDTRAVVAAVGVERPVVVGLSGGGSHLLVLVSAAPDLVRGAVAINPGPPADDEILADLPRTYRFLIKLARDRPTLFARAVKGLESNPGRVGRGLQRRMLHPTDLEVLQDPHTGPLMQAAAREGRAQPRAYTREASMIWGQPWGVSLTDFQVPLHVFAGRQDPIMPFALWLGTAGAMLHWFDGGHLSGFLAPLLDSVMATVAEMSAPPT